METTINVVQLYKNSGKTEKGFNWTSIRLVSQDGTGFTMFTPSKELKEVEEGDTVGLEVEAAKPWMGKRQYSIIRVISINSPKSKDNATPRNSMQMAKPAPGNEASAKAGTGKDGNSSLLASKANPNKELLNTAPAIPSMSEESPRNLYIKAIDTVINTCNEKGVPISFSDIGKVFEAEIEVRRQQFEAQHSIFIAESKFQDRKRAKENLSSRT